jgi:hypothetical protein
LIFAYLGPVLKLTILKEKNNLMNAVL